MVASQGKVSEKSGNLDMDIEWQPCRNLFENGSFDKSDIVKVKEIDRNVKNKFSFAWLERTVEIASGLKVSLGDDIAKTDDAGQAV